MSVAAKKVAASPMNGVSPLSISADLLRRVDAIRAEIDAIVDRRVAEAKAAAESIPAGVLRQLITRHETCACAVAKMLAKETN